MRAFILCALVAIMATTVSCQEFPVSAACQNSSDVLESNANVTLAEANNGKGGCTELLLGDSCTYNEAIGFWSCSCVTTYVNKSAVDATITAAGGQPCYVDLKFEFFGNQTYNNVSRPVTLVGTHTAQTFMVFGSACNSSDFSGFFGAVVNASAPEISNADKLKKGNTTWVGAKLTVSGSCGGSRSVSITFSSGSATTSPPSNAGGNGTTTVPPTTNTTSSPTTTPAPGSSSTGRSGASIIASSAALVASLIAAVTILA